MEVVLAIATILGAVAALGYFRDKWAARKETAQAEPPLEVSAAPEVLIPGRVADLIYEGKAGRWSTIVEAYKEALGKERLEPDERLALVVAYDIARARKLVHYDGELVFFDSSWLTHDYGFWSANAEMRRWLEELSKIAFRRARRGRQTSRAFYWRPGEIKTLVELELAKETIVAHLVNGIRVFLVDPIHWPTIVDVQIFTRTDGIVSTAFADFTLNQLEGDSEMSPFLHRYEELKALVERDEALLLPLNTPAAEVLGMMVKQCPNLLGTV